MGVQGYKEFTAFLGKVETKFKKAKWLEEATEFVYEEAIRRVPIRTGELARSIDYEMGRNDEGRYGCVYSDLEHSLYVEFGTGPVGASNHAGISPEVPVTYTEREKWSYQDKQGNWHTTSGQPAQPFLYPALKDNEQRIIEIANKGINEVLKDD